MIRLAAVPAVLIILALPGSAGTQDTNTTVKAAFDRCRMISEEVSAIRQISFTNTVEVALQSMEDFSAYIDREISEQYGDSNAVNAYVDALVLLGALKERIDFNSTMKDMMVSQAAAHYDPRKKTYYLLMTDAPAFLVDVISSHELCHALQDHNFNLKSLMIDDPASMRDNGDAAMARQCLAEGDATVVMIWWALSRQMPEATRAQLSASTSIAVGTQASLDFETLNRIAAESTRNPEAGFASLAGSIDDLEKFPRFFIESLYTAYLQGALAVDLARREGGWEAVNALFRNPPASSEQILHPEKMQGPERDEPVDIRLPEIAEALPAEWSLAEEDVLGELGVRILLSLWSTDTAEAVTAKRAAAGWDGDRYYYFTAQPAGEMLVWQTAWDTEKDAEEFAGAISASIKCRYKSPEPLDAGKGCLAWKSDSRTLVVRKSGLRVLVINTPSSFTTDRIEKIIRTGL